MAKPYSQDLRERMVRAVLAGQSRRGGHKHYVLAEQEDKVRAFVAETPDLTIPELWQKITAQARATAHSGIVANAQTHK